MDFEEFYESCCPARSKPAEPSVLSADGKGIVIASGRAADPRPGPAPRGPRTQTPGPRGEQQTNRRAGMAEIGAVYDAKPAPCTPADILSSAAPQGYEPAPGPVAANKWLLPPASSRRQRR